MSEAEFPAAVENGSLWADLQNGTVGNSARIEVELLWHEVSMAAHVGALRRIESLRSGNYRPMYQSNESEWKVEEEGACAEVAYAKATGRYWSGSVNSFHDPDVAGVQIRHTVRPNGCLIVRDRDPDDHRYVLVTGIAPNFVVVGAIRGEQAKQERWLRDPGGRHPAYFVPQDQLWPVGVSI